MTQKPKPLDLEDIENEILNVFEREKLRLLNLSKEKIDWNSYYVGRFEELGVLKRIVRTLLKEEGLIKQRIKSPCEFYLRYKDKPELLVKEHPKYEKIGIVSYVLQAIEVEKIHQDEYNEWLFKLAFKDVFKNANEK